MGSTGNHPYPDEWEMVTENGVVRKNYVQGWIPTVITNDYKN